MTERDVKPTEPTPANPVIAFWTEVKQTLVKRQDRAKISKQEAIKKEVWSDAIFFDGKIAELDDLLSTLPLIFDKYK